MRALNGCGLSPLAGRGCRLTTSADQSCRGIVSRSFGHKDCELLNGRAWKLASGYYSIPFSVHLSMFFRRRFLRRTILILAALFMCSWLTFHSVNANRWRRTAQGWVSNLAWESQQAKWDPPPATGLHPFLVTSFQLLLSVGGLLAFDHAVEKATRSDDE